MRNHHGYGESLPQHEFEIGTDVYRFTDIVHTGRNAVVLQLRHSQTDALYALKVWRSHATDYHSPEHETEIKRMLQSIAGFEWVEKRVLISAQSNFQIVAAFPVLANSVIMPWFGFPSWRDFKIFFMNPEIGEFVSLNGVKQAASYDTLVFALRFAQILARLEDKGMIYHDLNDSNILINLVDMSASCIDLESIHFADTTIKNHGELANPGYQFQSYQNSLHNNRFTGALLLCEMLCLAEIRSSGLYQGESYFTPSEIDFRLTTNERFQMLIGALSSLSPQLVTLFEKAWTATTPTDCPAINEWHRAIARLSKLNAIEQTPPLDLSYSKFGASSDAPALIIFAIDARKSKTDEISSDSEHTNSINSIIGETIRNISSNCRLGRYHVSPKYHVAIIVYGRNTQNLFSCNPPQFPPIHQNIISNNSLGILQIPQLLVTDMPFHEQISQALHDVDNSTTHMTKMFEVVYTLLHEVIPQYKDCPPPLVYHVTSGHNFDDGDPAKIAHEIQSLSTNFGNVKIATIISGRNVIDTSIKTKNWIGVTDVSSFRQGNRGMGRFLMSISSRVTSKHYYMFSETEYEIEDTSYLLFPADETVLVRNTFQKVMWD